MNATHNHNKQSGFSLLEMLVSVMVFLLISGTIFQLLTNTQKQGQTESQVRDTFQEARLGLDQIVRDIEDAGYPPANHFSTLPAVTGYAQTPVAWSPNYPGTACTVGSTCTTPGSFDIIFEEDYDGSGTVKWVRYQLQGTTLWRGVTPKLAATDPATATSAAGVMYPYVQNVMNNASSAQITAIRAIYPNMFPGGNPVPIFNYTIDPNSGTVGCVAAVSSPCNIRDVQVRLIVQTPQRDATSEVLRLVELNGRGHRLNPNQ
ncbi:MAG TPA: type II secretion system protein [Candidatus Acidoferrum sp.]|nr:type II secretion system protein [Candidatus Acidoferrum sp.]